MLLQEKNRYKEKWGENTSGEPDYNTRLEQGHYDDGVAIICGQLDVVQIKISGYRVLILIAKKPSGLSVIFLELI